MDKLKYKSVKQNGCLVVAKNCERLRTYDMCLVTIHFSTFNPKLPFAHENNTIHNL